MSTEDIDNRPWPPVKWQYPINECPQYDFISIYLGKRPFAHISEEDRSEFPVGKLKQFLYQVRSSRGYDAEYWVPESQIIPQSLEIINDTEGCYYEFTLKHCQFAVSHINEQAKLHGEEYEYVGLEKAVFALRMKLYTFSVKEVSSLELKTVQACVFTGPPLEVLEWRFKPGVTAASTATHSNQQGDKQESHSAAASTATHCNQQGDKQESHSAAASTATHCNQQGDKQESHAAAQEQESHYDQDVEKEAGGLEEFGKDFVGRGRKRRFESSGEQWPPVWKAVEECPEYPLIRSYLCPWEFETTGDESLYPYHKSFPITKFKEFLQSVRETRGYDVHLTRRYSNILLETIPVLYLIDLGLSCFKSLSAECEFVVAKINEEAKMHGVEERYVYDKIKKLVKGHMFRFSLHTFTVREVSSLELKTVQSCTYEVGSKEKVVQGWRFKPDLDDTSTDQTQQGTSANKFISSRGSHTTQQVGGGGGGGGEDGSHQE